MYKIAVIPGDGTGPEVVREGLKVMAAIAAKKGFKYDDDGIRLRRRALHADGRGAARNAAETLRKFDAIYLGAIGHPDVKPGILEKGILLQPPLRAGPVHQPASGEALPGRRVPASKDKKPEDIDFVVIRENSEDFYVGTGGTMKVGTPDEIAIQTGITTRKGVDRCLRYAFDLAGSATRRRC